MAFWDFFKKNKQTEKETVQFEHLKIYLNDKKQESEKQKNSILAEISVNLNILAEDLQKSIQILKEVDVSSKKAEDKVKLIVKENLVYYIHHLEKLKEKLEELSKEEDKELNIIGKINNIFSEFEKKSHLNFEKATFLIGEELGNVKESMKIFFKKIKEILNENKQAIENLNAIYEIEKKEKILEELEKNDYDIKKNIEKLEKEIIKIKEYIKSKENEIETIKSSDKFLAEIKKRESFNAKKKEREKELLNLRGMVDFKALTNFYHTFEKEMSLIKQYRDNFLDSFNKNNGGDLTSLLQESHLENEEINSKIKEIEEKKKEIESTVFEKTGIEENDREIKECSSIVASRSLQKAIEEKRVKKVLESLEQTKSEIKDSLAKINVEIV